MAKKVLPKDDMGYLYLVKNPSYNDKSVVAWGSVLYAGTQVIYETKYGLDLGIILGPAPQAKKAYEPGSTEIRGACSCVSSSGCHMQCSSCGKKKKLEKIKIDGSVTWIDHLATPVEVNKSKEDLAKEDYALVICREKAEKRKMLDTMRLVSAHFLTCEPKVVFFFYSPMREDFRALVKDLAPIFKLRIEMRQINDRDETSIVGGMSICGREFCCHSHGLSTRQVQIKMAKDQDMSLNSSKVQGPCGKLLCCLAYEHDYYMEEKAKLPQVGSRLRIDRELWKVTNVNVLSRKISCQSPEGRVVEIPADELMQDEVTGHWVVDEEFEEELFLND